jgi:hypothetical protein
LRRLFCLPVTDPERVRATVRHLRRLRRAQLALGAGAVTAGAGALLAWDAVGRDTMELPWVGMFAALLIVSLVIRAVVGPH